MARVPVAVSGEKIPSSGWNSIRDLVETSGWNKSSGLSLNTIFQNGDNKAFLTADILMSASVVNNRAVVQFLTDAGSPPTIMRQEMEVSGALAFRNIQSFIVPIEPSAYFQISVVNSGAGITLQRGFLYNQS